MIIKSLKLKNFQLFSEAGINFDKINLIAGVNLDDVSSSGNGSGKTTILNAILFALYGNVTNLNIADLIKIGEKEAEITLTFTHKNSEIIIYRKIPSFVKIIENGKDLQFNTATLAQNYINELLGEDINNFRTYRMIDNTKGINLLDLGIVSLRKSLMDMINQEFTKIRTNLLAQKNDREKFSQDKKLYKHFLSSKRREILKQGINNLLENKKEIQNNLKEVQSAISKVNGNISAKERIITYKNNEIQNAKKGMCPILKTSCDRIGKKLSASAEHILTDEIVQLNRDIELVRMSITADCEYLSDLEHQLNEFDFKIEKARRMAMRLESAFQFIDYKYTKEDIQLYSDTIKVLDSFSGYYINKWLDNLAMIINDLLSSMNMSVEFNAEKSFLTVKNNQNLKYEQLSSGQKVFLNSVFKLGILLNQGISDGIILIDEGINSLDKINFNKFLDILKNLNFQVILVYQNLERAISDVYYIDVERKEGISTIK